MTKMMTMIQTMQGMFGGVGRGSSVSPWAMALSNPTLWQAAVKAIETIQMAILARSGILPQTYTGGTPSLAAPPAPAPPLSELGRAIQTRDPRYFPQMATLLGRAAGPQADALFSAIHSGEVTAAILLQSARPFLPELQLPGTEVYLDDFLRWVRSQAVPPPPPSPAPTTAPSTAPPSSSPSDGRPPSLSAKCETCGMEYQYNSRPLWEEDDKVCDNGECRGTIRLEGEDHA